MVTTDQGVAATQPFGLPIARSPVAFVPFSKATGILHDVRALDGQAGRGTADAASGSPAGATGVAGVVTRLWRGSPPRLPTSRASGATCGI